MWSRVLLVVWVWLGVAIAGNGVDDAPVAAPAPKSDASSVNTDAKILRQGLADFGFDPEARRLELRFLNAQASQPLAVDRLEVFAIGDEAERGRSVQADLTRVNASSFRGTLNVPEGGWNLIVRVKNKATQLQGQFVLSVGKSPTSGRLALVPPNPEVNRLTTLFAWLFGVPLALAALVTAGAILWRYTRPPKSTTSSS